MDQDAYIWEGIDREGVRVTMSREAWELHVLKHPEIEPFLDGVAETICDPEKIFRDTRPDEISRYFRRLYKSGVLTGEFANHYVRVGMKYVNQPDGSFWGFYSTSYFVREISERSGELEFIHRGRNVNP